MEHLIYIIPLFFLTALIYSSVGFGGGSTYLALLVLFSVPYELMPKAALICNLVVVTGGLYHYIRNHQLSLKTALPFAVASVPMAYFGGRIPVGKNLFLVLLGLSLACAGLRLLLSFPPQATIGSGNPILDPRSRSSRVAGMTIGAPLGFLSGLTGIGGGIFLAPLLYLMKWGNARQIAAMSCFFIFVNSLSGLLGQLSKDWAIDVGAYGRTPLPVIISLILAVFLGGQIGNRLSVGKLSLGTLQRTTAVLILIVAGRIFWGFL